MINVEVGYGFIFGSSRRMWFFFSKCVTIVFKWHSDSYFLILTFPFDLRITQKSYFMPRSCCRSLASFQIAISFDKSLKELVKKDYQSAVNVLLPKGMSIQFRANGGKFCKLPLQWEAIIRAFHIHQWRTYEHRKREEYICIC